MAMDFAFEDNFEKNGNIHFKSYMYCRNGTTLIIGFTESILLATLIALFVICINKYCYKKQDPPTTNLNNNVFTFLCNVKVFKSVVLFMFNLSLQVYGFNFIINASIKHIQKETLQRQTNQTQPPSRPRVSHATIPLSLHNNDSAQTQRENSALKQKHHATTDTLQIPVRATVIIGNNSNHIKQSMNESNSYDNGDQSNQSKGSNSAINHSIYHIIRNVNSNVHNNQNNKQEHIQKIVAVFRQTVFYVILLTAMIQFVHVM